MVCVDEKPVVLHQEIRPPQATRPGRVARRDGEYQRCGTANVFCGVQPQAGRYFPKVTDSRSSLEFADYLLEVAIRYPEADTIHLVLDNLSSHTRKAAVERFGEKAGGWLWNRFTVHYTPKHGGWLNQAEIAISLFSRQCLGRRRIRDRGSLQRETRAWGRRMNRDRVPIRWSFTRKKARHTFDYTITRFTVLGAQHSVGKRVVNRAGITGAGATNERSLDSFSQHRRFNSSTLYWASPPAFQFWRANSSQSWASNCALTFTVGCTNRDFVSSVMCQQQRSQNHPNHSGVAARTRRRLCFHCMTVALGSGSATRL